MKRLSDQEVLDKYNRLPLEERAKLDETIRIMEEAGLIKDNPLKPKAC